MQAAIYSGMELNALLSFAVWHCAIAPELVSVLFGTSGHAGVLCSLLSIYGLTRFRFSLSSLLASGGAGNTCC